jgi:PAS domain-containing protein
LINGAGADERVARLTALVARQREEIDQLHVAAAARSVVDLARGVLMERLGCSAAEAGRELHRIAAEAGTAPAQLAAEIAGQTAEDQLLTGRLPAEADQPSPLVLSVPLAAAASALAPDATGLAAALLSETLSDAGAAAVAIWLTAPDGATELAGQAGLPSAEASRWLRIPPGVDVPAVRASTRGGPTWWPAGQPATDRTPLVGPWPAGARCVIPIRQDGHTLGALEVCWRHPVAEFSAPLQRQITSLADLCGQALGSRLSSGLIGPDQRARVTLALLDGLAEPVLFALAVRDDAGRVVDFTLASVGAAFRDPAGRPAHKLAGQSLLAAYPEAARPGGLFDLAIAALATGQPQELSAEQMAAERTARIAALFDGVVISYRQVTPPEWSVAMLEQVQRLGGIGAWEEISTTGTVYWTDSTYELFGVPPGSPVRLTELEQHVVPADVPSVAAFRARLLADKAAAVAAFQVVREDDASIRQFRAFAEPVLGRDGEVVAVRGAYQDVSARYHAEIALAVTRDQLSGSERRVAEEHELALQLQEAITPHSSSQLVEAAGLAVAARYRPAGAGHLVSGDWYDITPLPTRQVLLVVGDVAGHGISAVTGMVALRNSLRGLAVSGAGPARLLSLLNAFACHLTDDVLATAICGLYDPARGRLRWARAGHLPPVLTRSGRARQLRQPHGLLLGADPRASYEEVTTQLRAGDRLLLFTDGVIERRDQAIDDSLRELLQIAAEPTADVDEFADALLAAAASDTGDDACLLAVSVR